MVGRLASGSFGRSFAGTAYDRASDSHRRRRGAGDQAAVAGKEERDHPGNVSRHERRHRYRAEQSGHPLHDHHRRLRGIYRRQRSGGLSERRHLRHRCAARLQRHQVSLFAGPQRQADHRRGRWHRDRDRHHHAVPLRLRSGLHDGDLLDAVHPSRPGAGRRLQPADAPHHGTPACVCDAGDGPYVQRRRCRRRRLRQCGGGARPHRGRGAQGGAGNLRLAGGSGGDLAQAPETSAGRPDPPDRSGRPFVRRTHALSGGGGRLQGVLFAQEGLTPNLHEIVVPPLYRYRMRRWLCQILAAAVLAIALDPASRAMAQAAPVNLRILAINDFHGNLRPPAGGIRIADPADKTKKITVAAGGAEHMATLVRQLRQDHSNAIFVAAGDLIGASPFLSAMFHDEPTVEALSMMGLEVAAVGNHEFDEGKDELLRIQDGGCQRTDGCQGPPPFPGAKFHSLAASTFEKGTGKTIFPAYEIRKFDGIPVAFIGLTLKGTPTLVSPVGVASLEFRDEADTVNALVPELKARGVEAIVVLIHEGGFPAGDYNECPGISGPIVDIVKKFDKAVDVVISGHTHQAYVCEIDGRLVTSGDKYGTLVTTIDVKLDPATHDVISAKADNVIVRNAALARDSDQTALIAAYDTRAAPIAERRAGSVTDTLSRVPNEAGESVLGDIIADAQLAATRPDKDRRAMLALTNPGGIRTDIAKKEDGAVWRCLCQPAVPQPVGDTDADRRADQGHAGTAMARPKAAADPAGLQGIRIHLG